MDIFSAYRHRAGASSSAASPLLQGNTHQPAAVAADDGDQTLQQRIFSDKSRRLQNYLRDTKQVLKELQAVNRDKWNVHYPLDHQLVTSGGGLGRTLSFVDGPSSTDAPRPVQRTNSAQPYSPSSSATLTVDDGGSSSNNRLKVLRLDLRYAHEADSDIMSSLESSSIARLFDDKLAQTTKHLNRLVARVSDKSSKILVTGDLNAGKSTLVNALLRSEILPSDQQPCTMVFCEVLDAQKNGGAEEIHGIPDAEAYSPSDLTTFVRIDPKDLEDLVMDNAECFQQLKIYTKDLREESGSSGDKSLLNNGVTDVAIIDSPGLNRDSLKTTQLFARQEEIDVVVFVVSAENHFTLSGQDFLLSAGKEKAHIFIVVNKFDAIRRKDRCQRMILDQISVLSPHTAAEADELVHFVSARDMLESTLNRATPEGANTLPEFVRMERCLRTFALEQRFKSKLAPAQRYAYHVLQDVQSISDYNMNMAMRQIQEINALLRESTPRYETLLEAQSETSHRTEQLLDDSCSSVRAHAMTHLANTLESIAVPAERVEWAGLWNMWSYAETVIRAMAQHLEHEVGECERFAGFTINQAMAELKRIQGEQQHHIDRYKAIEKTTTAGAGGGDDIAISGSGEDLSTSYLAHIGSISNALDTFSLQPTDFVDFDWEKWMAMTSMSVSAGTLALLATRFNSLADSVLSLIRLSSTISSGTTHRVMLAAATLLGIGSAFYLVSDMDATVRNNVARRLRDALHEEGFAVNHADRLSTETSRSLRPFVWKLQHMFQRMVEAEERRRADQLNRRHMAQDAQMHFDEIRSKARELAELVAGLSGGGATDSSGTIVRKPPRAQADYYTLPDYMESLSSSSSMSIDRHLAGPVPGGYPELGNRRAVTPDLVL